jgi:hypothetical protein
MDQEYRSGPAPLQSFQKVKSPARQFQSSPLSEINESTFQKLKASAIRFQGSAQIESG